MRNTKIDLLRFIGLFMIILAHCSPPSALFQIRNFDVPLMVFISGISFKLSFKRKDNYFGYVLKRIKRLVFPVWLFLSIYFSLRNFLFPESISFSIIRDSFLLLSGIGYVWIVRVFLLVALVAPLLLKAEKKINSNAQYFSIIISIFIAYEVFQLYSYNYFQSNSYLKFLSSIVFYIIPYSLIYMLGIRTNNLSRIQVKKTLVLFLTIFTVSCIYFYVKQGRFVSTQLYKTPISTYYLSYALSVSYTLWLLANTIWNRLNKPLRKIILFISSNSIWIYLWHILFISVIHQLDIYFFIEYILVLFFAIGVTFLQVFVLEKIILCNISNIKVKGNLRTLLKG